jgi:hypothetical protein
MRWTTPRFGAALGLVAGLALAGCANGYERYAARTGAGVSCGESGGCHACGETPPCPPCPPQACPGEAWCRVLIPAQYETVWETVQLQCESCRCEWVPPVYETRVSEVCVRPACAREVYTPPVSRTIEECVEVCPKRTEMQRVCCPADPCPNPCAPRQADCWAQVEIPAQTTRVCREVCVSPAGTHTVYEPPLYETVAESCVVTPGYWRTVNVPAVYDRVCHQVCKCPARWEWRRNTTCTVPTPCAPPSPCVPSVRPAPPPVPVVVPAAPVAKPAPAPAPAPASAPATVPEPTPEPAPEPAPTPVR